MLFWGHLHNSRSGVTCKLYLFKVTKIDWEDPLESIPAYISIFAMSFMYSIAEGIAFGVISYVLLHLFARRTKDLSPAMYIPAVLFVAKYVML